jgi:DNA repair protein RadC
MLVRRIELIYGEGQHAQEPSVDRVTSASDAAAVFTQYLQAQLVEVFAVLCLSTRHDVIGYHEVSRGTLDAAIVHPREVFKAAVLANASAVIVGHNHPSGDPKPSCEDHRITDRLADAGRILGIAMLDHIVIGRGRFFSFRESGFLP